MKKLLLLPLLALCSCAPKYGEFVNVADFTKYVKDGFFIYPSGTDVKEKSYIPMADIEIYFRVGEKSKASEELNLKPSEDYKSYRLIIPTGEYMTGKAVNTAKTYGADGIINFNIEPIRVKGGTVGYNVKGTAVKISKQ